MSRVTASRVALRERAVVEADDAIVALAAAPDGATLAVQAATGDALMVAAPDGTVTARAAGHAGGTQSIAWRPDGAGLVTAGQDGIVRGVGLDGGQVFETRLGPSWVERVAWSPAGDVLAAAAGRRLHLLDTAGAVRASGPDEASTITDLAWHPRGGRVALAAYGGIVVRRAEDGEVARRFAWKGSALRLAWSADGRFLVTGDQDATVHVCFADGARDLQMWGFQRKVLELAWDRSGRWLATGGGDTPTVWDAGGRDGPEGRRPIQLAGHDAPVRALAWAPDGARLASCGDDGLVLLWAPRAKRRPLGSMALGVPLTALAWGNGGAWLAVGGADGLVRVLDVRAR